MPRTLEIDGMEIPVATEQELLDFANAVRRAGGANIIEALLPSMTGESGRCLIANALNFSCEVQCVENGASFADGSEKWGMIVPDNMTDERAAAIADAVPGVRWRPNGRDWRGRPHRYLSLPKHIGNAAKAFDHGVAFRDYDVELINWVDNAV